MYSDDFFKVGNVLMPNNSRGLIIKIVNGKPFNNLSFCGEVLQCLSGNYKEGKIVDSWDKEYKDWVLVKGYNTPLYKAMHGEKHV